MTYEIDMEGNVINSCENNSREEKILEAQRTFVSLILCLQDRLNIKFKKDL